MIMIISTLARVVTVLAKVILFFFFFRRSKLAGIWGAPDAVPSVCVNGWVREWGRDRRILRGGCRVDLEPGLERGKRVANPRLHFSVYDIFLEESDSTAFLFVSS